MLGEVRCDLHPRFNSNGSKISIDIVRQEFREMNIIELK